MGVARVKKKEVEVKSRTLYRDVNYICICEKTCFWQFYFWLDQGSYKASIYNAYAGKMPLCYTRIDKA